MNTFYAKILTHYFALLTYLLIEISENVVHVHHVFLKIIQKPRTIVYESKTSSVMGNSLQAVQFQHLGLELLVVESQSFEIAFVHLNVVYVL